MELRTEESNIEGLVNHNGPESGMGNCKGCT